MGLQEVITPTHPPTHPATHSPPTHTHSGSSVHSLEADRVLAEGLSSLLLAGL